MKYQYKNKKISLSIIPHSSDYSSTKALDYKFPKKEKIFFGENGQIFLITFF